MAEAVVPVTKVGKCLLEDPDVTAKAVIRAGAADCRHVAALRMAWAYLKPAMAGHLAQVGLGFAWPPRVE